MQKIHKIYRFLWNDEFTELKRQIYQKIYSQGRRFAFAKIKIFTKKTRKFLTFAFVNEFCVKSLLHYFLREKKCQ